MTFDPTKPVMTRDGRKARILAADVLGEDPIVAAIELTSDKEIVREFGPSGRYAESKESPLDLVNIPERKERFMNIHAPEDYSIWTSLTDLKEESYKRRSWDPIGTILKLTFEGDNLVDVEILEKR